MSLGFSDSLARYGINLAVRTCKTNKTSMMDVPTAYPILKLGREIECKICSFFSSISSLLVMIPSLFMKEDDDTLFMKSE